MDIILEKVQRLEQDVVELRGELVASKQELRSNGEKVDWMEQKLIQSEMRITELEKTKENTPAPSSTKCHCPMDTTQVKALTQRLEDVEKKCNDESNKSETISELQRVLNIALLKSQTSLLATTPETQSGGNEISCHTVTERSQRSCISKDDVFSVNISHRNPLEIGKLTKLDSLLEWRVPSTTFDRDNVSFKPAYNGVYCVNVEGYQGGDGEMDVVLRSCSTGIAHYIGTTNGVNSKVSSLLILALTEGEEFWVEVKTLKGSPKVHWCIFSGFLLAKNVGSASSS